MAKLGLSPWIWNALPLAVVVYTNHFLLNDFAAVDFQRFGAIWICLAVILIGFFIRRAANQLARMEEFKSSVSLLKHRLVNVNEKDNIEAELSELGTRMDALKVSISHDAKSLTLYEVLIICLGTLQTSYGDLFHCWFNGKGWTTC